MKRCETCEHYNPLKSGDPPAGWCEFTANVPIPMWMEKFRSHVDSLGADVVATDGEDCDAYKGPQT